MANLLHALGDLLLTCKLCGRDYPLRSFQERRAA